MDEQEFNTKRDRYELVTTDVYKKIKNQQLEVILGLAKVNYEPLELRGMLKLIAKTDDWKEDFIKIRKKG